MSFLKKLGLAILKGVGIASGIEQFLPARAATETGKIVGELQQIGGIVVTAEGMIGAIGGANGATKLKAATPFVAQLIQQSELVAGKKIKNEELFIQGCTSITSGAADVLNSLE